MTINGMLPEPSREHLLDRVRTTFTDDVLGMTCLDCGTLEIVRGDPRQFNDEVHRFLRTHPGACAQLEQGSTRRLALVPRVG